MKGCIDQVDHDCAEQQRFGMDCNLCHRNEDLCNDYVPSRPEPQGDPPKSPSNGSAGLRFVAIMIFGAQILILK